MKITHARFENFAGFFTGMNLKELELDFESHAGPNAINMIFGRNRSGKSCLVSVLQPFPGTNDIRKNIIIEGENGRKTIEFLREDGNRFKIDIRYILNVKDKKYETKCYFYAKEGENWKNMNPSGRITSYTDLVEEHLHVTEDYFTVGRIGGVSNFIDLTKSNRKKYIANFLPDIDPYLQIHNTVSTKYTALKKSMTTFSDELIKLQPADICAASIVDTETKLEEKNHALGEEQTKYGSYKGVIDHILAETDETIPELREFARTGVNPFDRQAEDLNKKIGLMESALPENFNPDTNKAELAALKSQLESKKIDLSRLEANEVNAKSAVVGAEDNLNAVKADLAAIENQNDEYVRQKETVDRLKQEVEEDKKAIRKEFSSPKFNRFANYGIREIETLKRESTEARRLINDIRRMADDAGISGINYFNKSEIDKALFDSRNAIKAHERVAERVAEYQARIPDLQKAIKLEEVLDKRPANCRNDECPFIAAALDAKGSKAELSRINIFLDSDEVRNHDAMEAEIEIERKKFSFLENFGRMYEEFRDTCKKMLSLRLVTKIQEVIDLPERFVEIVNGSEFALKDAFDVSDIDAFVASQVNYQEKTRLLNEATNVLNGMKSVETFVASNTEKKKAAEAKLKEAADKCNEITGQVLITRDEINEIKDKIGKLEMAETAFKRIEEKKAELDTLNSKIQLMTGYVKEIETNRNLMLGSNKILSGLRDEIRDLESIRDGWNIQINKRKELEAKIAEIEAKFKTVDIVKRATDTVKGIPIYLIDTYLEDIRIRANHLLDLTFHGGFRLDKFVINEKEFAIPVIKGDGSRLDDCLEGSGAEQSFVKEAISFAIIEKAIRGYNIVSLDEVDGVLDQTNRMGFIKMLKQQIEELGLEQVFIISHVREFLNDDLNLILLRDHGIETEDKSFMANKHVVFDFYA